MKKKILIVEDNFSDYKKMCDYLHVSFDICPNITVESEFNSFRSKIVRSLKNGKYRDQTMEELISSYKDVSLLLVDYELEKDCSEVNGIDFYQCFISFRRDIEMKIPAIFVSGLGVADTYDRLNRFIEKTNKETGYPLVSFQGKRRNWNSDTTFGDELVDNIEEHINKYEFYPIKKELDIASKRRLCCHRQNNVDLYHENLSKLKRNNKFHQDLLSFLEEFNKRRIYDDESICYFNNECKKFIE